MQVSPGSVASWTLLVGIGLGIFAIRVSFIQLRARLGGIPPAVERALKLLPVAIIAALVSPDVFVTGGRLTGIGSLPGVLVTPRVLAAAVAVVTARRTGSILATVVAGMGTLWLVRLLLG